MPSVPECRPERMHGKGSRNLEAPHAEQTRVIARFWSVVVHRSDVDIFLEYVENTVIPIYEAADGLVRVEVLRRSMVSYEEVLTVSFWRSEQNLRRLAISEPATDNIKEKYGAIPLEPRTYEIAFPRDGQRPGDED